MALIDESTLTAFMAKMSVDTTGEQARFLADPAQYARNIAQLANPLLPVAARNVLIGPYDSAAHRQTAINNAMLGEQRGSVHIQSDSIFVITYNPGQALADNIIQLIRNEVDQRMGRR
jgi:hypothetical protein